MKQPLIWRKRVLRGLALALLLGSGVALAEPPEWLLAAARQPTPTLPTAAPALVLLDETVMTLGPDGRVAQEHRFAVRVLNRSGTELARGLVHYRDKQDAVRITAAWLVRGGKEVVPPKKREWADVSMAATGAIYDEGRARGIDYTELALVGDVFGYEARVEGPLLFGQLSYGWGNTLPLLVERFSVRLPPGWTSEPRLDGPQAAALKVSTGPQSTTWELHDRPYRPSEPAMPDTARDDAQLLLNFESSTGAKGAVLPVFRTWAEVAAWDIRNSQGQCDSDAALSATVKKLVADCPDALGRIKALCRHVQQLRYVAVNKGFSLGLGYRPRKATEVNAKGWGDCKDKANLLSAMLREIGVDSVMVSARLGGGRSVNPAWPSPKQFNHAILAIRVDGSVTQSTVLEVPGVGRLLFFDATDPDTLVGDLPWQLQGTKVQVLALGDVGLTTLPILPTETHHRLERRVRLELLADGSLTGECAAGGPGSDGSLIRQKLRSTSAKDLRIGITNRLNETVRGAVLKDVTSTDDPLTGECWVTYGFTAPRFGQPMAGGLVLVRLDVLSRETVPAFPDKQRWSPVQVPPELQRDEVTFKLPAGFVVDEMTEAIELNSAYGSYTSRFGVANGEVTVHRVLQLKEAIVPVSEYAALRQFFGDVAKADRAALVLRNDGPAAGR